MSNLSNLFISASYKGIINLADSTKDITSQSNQELQDGMGNPIGLSILSGSLSVDNEISSSTINGIGNVTLFSQSVDNRLDQLEADTGSQDGRLDSLEIASQSLQNYTSSLKQALTVSGDDATFTNDVTIVGTLNVSKIVTTIESSSVIFSSGSNQLGDEAIDVQIFSGSVYVPNEHYLKGNLVDTDTRINNKLESSWTSSAFGPFSSSVSSEIIDLDNTKLDITDFNTYTQSVEDIYNTKLDNSWTSSVFLPFSTSVDDRLDVLEAFTGIVTGSYTKLIDFNAYTQSTDTRITDLENFSTSLDDSFVSEVEFASFSSSTDTAINELSSSVSSSDAEQNNRIDVLSSFTGSYATTGSNVFNGNQTINGYVQGGLTNIVIVDSTASIDCSLGNFFTADVTGSVRLQAENINPGQTVVLKLDTNLGTSITIDTGSIKFPQGYQYQASNFQTEDVITFVTFDTGSLYGVSANGFE